MKAVVTGAAGFVGSSLVDTLLHQGHEVLGIDCFTDYYPRHDKVRNLEHARSFDAFSLVEGDLRALPLLQLIEGVDWIFHQAAQAGVRASWGKSFELYTNHNVLATQQLLEVLKDEKARTSLKKIVYASSSSVYGSAETLPTSEKTLPKPVSPYGVTKLAAEHLMGLYAKEYGVPTVSLRYFTVYGPRQRPDMAFHRFIRAGFRGETISVYGDGEQSRDFTFIDDIISANISAVDAGKHGLVLNIGGGSRVSVNEVLRLLDRILGKPLQRIYQARQAGDARHTGADISLATEILVYRPTVKLEDGLRKEVAWVEKIVSAQ